MFLCNKVYIFFQQRKYSTYLMLFFPHHAMHNFIFLSNPHKDPESCFIRTISCVRPLFLKLSSSVSSCALSNLVSLHFSLLLGRLSLHLTNLISSLLLLTSVSHSFSICNFIFFPQFAFLHRSLNSFCCHEITLIISFYVAYLNCRWKLTPHNTRMISSEDSSGALECDVAV